MNLNTITAFVCFYLRKYGRKYLLYNISSADPISFPRSNVMNIYELSSGNSKIK